MVTLKGLCAFPITPADADGRVGEPALRRILARLLRAEVDSIGLLGSTGTYPYFTRAERRRAIEIAVDEARGGTPVLVGIGALRTDEAVRLAQDARAAGAAAGLLAPVSYAPLNDEEVFELFATVAHDSGLPLAIYNNPGTTHFTITPALVGRLAGIPNVVAIKSGAPEAPLVRDDLAERRRLVPAGFSVGYSADWNVAEALIAGGDVWYSVAGGLFPKTCLALVRAAQRGDAAEARRLDATLQPLWDLFREFTSLRTVYAIANRLELSDAQPPRPILPLAAAAQWKIAEVLKGLALS